MIDLSPKDLEEVKKILKQYVPDYRVVAFGSRANRTASSRSDLDLCLMGDKSLTLNDIAMLEDAFSISNLDIKVDLVDWAKVKSNFRDIIQKDSVVIQEAGKSPL